MRKMVIFIVLMFAVFTFIAAYSAESANPHGTVSNLEKR